ncbi:hypothetical protein AKL13_01034 [Streptococcus parauberis]|nr:hypothetical protein AKL13_01034 [Streptococcus parauberis]
MKKMMTSGQVIVSILIIVGYYWNNLPPINTSVVIFGYF